MTRSRAALIIAVLFHLLILLLIWLLALYFAQHSPKPAAKPKEQRIKVSLKPKPTAKTSAPVKNNIRPKQKIPPMPKGSQLKKLSKATSETKPLPTPKQLVKAVPPTPQKPQQKIPTPKKYAAPEKTVPKTEPVPPKEPYIPFMKPEEKAKKPEKSPDHNVTSVPKQHQKLFAELSQKQANLKNSNAASEMNRRQSLIPNDIREAYGDMFGKLSRGEQKYLLDNQEVMRRLTQQQLNQTGSVMIPNTLRVNDYDIVEFYLHPNGDMTDFRFVHRSGFSLLDDVTKETIESVYWKYPRPKQKTLIRYKFGYYLRGY